MPDKKPDQVQELTDQSEQLMAELARVNDRNRALSNVVDAQNLRINALERALAVSSGAAPVAPLTINLEQNQTT